MNKLFYIIPLLMIGLVGLATAAITGCINATGAPVTDNTGGWPAYNDTGVITNVTAGNVCVNATDFNIAPTVTHKCADWLNCAIGQCSAGVVYVGYSGDGTNTCTSTNYVTGVGTGVISSGYRINATAVVATCSITNTGGTATYTGCLNAYTRAGTSGYCDGAGNNQTAGLHVTDGSVCSVGSNVAANSTNNCGTWYDCVTGMTTYANYYTGYAAAGSTCSATNWVATGNSFTLPAGLAISFTANSATSCDANVKGDTAPVVAGINNLKGLAYAGFALLAVGILVVVAFGLLQLFKGGNVDFLTISVFAISTGVIILIAYVIIYFVAKALGA